MRSDYMFYSRREIIHNFVMDSYHGEEAESSQQLFMVNKLVSKSLNTRGSASAI